MKVLHTHCKSGRHELTDENIYVSNGHRGCKLCKLEYSKHRRPVKRLERLIETHNIMMSEVWKASELVRLKQSIGSCYLAEIRADQQSGIKAPQLNNDQSWHQTDVSFIFSRFNGLKIV